MPQNQSIHPFNLLTQYNKDIWINHRSIEQDSRAHDTWHDSHRVFRTVSISSAATTNRYQVRWNGTGRNNQSSSSSSVKYFIIVQIPLHQSGIWSTTKCRLSRITFVLSYRLYLHITKYDKNITKKSSKSWRSSFIATSVLLGPPQKPRGPEFRYSSIQYSSVHYRKVRDRVAM